MLFYGQIIIQNCNVLKMGQWFWDNENAKQNASYLIDKVKLR